jgi:hypothetical protein
MIRPVYQAWFKDKTRKKDWDIKSYIKRLEAADERRKKSLLLKKRYNLNNYEKFRKRKKNDSKRWYDKIRKKSRFLQSENSNGNEAI